MNDQSILTDIKKLLGLDENYTPFDTDIVLGVNAALATLAQLSDGEVRVITGATETWSIFGTTDQSFLNLAKMYIYLKTRLSFDPPTNSFLVTSMEKQILEYEWRLEVMSHKTVQFPVEP